MAQIAAAQKARDNFIRRVLAGSSTSGVLLIISAALALAISNSPLAPVYFAGLAASVGGLSVSHWINDGLMALFFLLVGLEIKRELIDGQLASWAQRRLPVLPAVLGMACPAIVYLLFAGGPETASGWAIPAATDIAFAIGVLTLLGKRVPLALKVLLASIAIVDDLGAVLIIALFYTDSLNLIALGAAAGLFCVMLAMNRWRVSVIWPYMLIFAALWCATLLSGLHATIAGVLTAFAVPIARPLQTDTRSSALHRLEHGLAPWVGLLIVPVFGFANAGVALNGMGPTDLLAPLPLGVAGGLFIGKQIGVFGGVLIAVKSGLAAKPTGVTWAQIYGLSLLCGVGFTMSLFIGSLAFPASPHLLDQAKIGILAGSLLSAALGFGLLRATGDAKP